jgi:hypothetical protein
MFFFERFLNLVETIDIIGLRMNVLQGLAITYGFSLDKPE